ncbi:MAG: FeoB small GTPase domain-containing protein, partial [Myxococcota bacterium]
MTTIALAGNPNCGKTTLFNRLTGLRQKIGNYPGVTIERRTGTFKFNNRTATMIDLPGAYSLVASSQDEAIAFETLYGRSGSEPPDAVVVLVDATNLARTLYLAVSIIELGRPTIVAVNMMDEVPPDEIDLEALAQTLKVPVVGLSAKRGDGIDALHATLEKTLEQDLSRPGRSWQLDADSEAVIKAASEACSHQKPAEDRCWCEGMAIWAIASWANQQQIAAPTADIEPPASDLRAMIDAAKGKLTTSPQTLAAKIIEARYETT